MQKEIMQKIKRKYIIFFSIISLIFVTIALGEAFLKTGKYNFPVKPGTEAWKQLKTHDEMIAISQVPENILFKMTTEELVITCLEYPLYGDFMTFNDKLKGIERAISSSNCLRELLKRSDAGSELLNQYFYVRDDINDFLSYKTDDINYFKHSYIEMLLAQKAVRQKMTQIEKRTLLNECLENVKLMQKRPDAYGFTSLQPTLLIMKKITGDEKEHNPTETAITLDEEHYCPR